MRHAHLIPLPLVAAFVSAVGGFELTIDGNGRRASPGAAVAHITLGTPGSTALKFDVRGAIVPGSFPTTYSGGLNRDVRSCG